jgi:hypothetical protein
VAPTSLTGLTVDDSEKIRFVVACLFSSTISQAEPRSWCLHTIQELDTSKIPSYLYKLAEFDEPLARVFQIIGFVPHWHHTDDERSALFGIVVNRGASRNEWPVDAVHTLKTLAENLSVEQRFRREFPFVQY